MNFVGCRLMPPTPHGFLGRRRACHGGLSWAGLGASEGPKSTPEGAKRAPRRSLGASWAPGRPQVATKAALRPPLGGSWGALGALLRRSGGPLGLLGAAARFPGALWARFWSLQGCDIGPLLLNFEANFEALKELLALTSEEHFQNADELQTHSKWPRSAFQLLFQGAPWKYQSNSLWNQSKN